jgi:hypothetical protein
MQAQEPKLRAGPDSAPNRTQTAHTVRQFCHSMPHDAANKSLLESFSSSRTMTVHIFQHDLLVRCTCSSRGRNCPVEARSAISNIVCTKPSPNIGRVDQSKTQPYTPDPPLNLEWLNQLPTLSYARASHSLRVPIHTANTYAQANHPSLAPVYTANSFGLAVNIRHGTILTEPRTIFIQNLNFHCSWDDLNVLLTDKTEHFVRATLIKDSHGIYKGAATAEFLSPKAAQIAISTLEGFTHMGRKPHARLAKEESYVRQTGPLIATSPTYFSAIRE